MSSNPQSEASALDASRPRFEFTIPEAARTRETDPAVVVMREITVAEDEMASKAAGGLGIKYATEALKHSLIEADGKPLSWADGGKERFLEGCGALVRSLLFKAYDALHIPKEDVSASFLGSRKMRA